MFASSFNLAFVVIINLCGFHGALLLSFLLFVCITFPRNNGPFLCFSFLMMFVCLGLHFLSRLLGSAWLPRLSHRLWMFAQRVFLPGFAALFSGSHARPPLSMWLFACLLPPLCVQTRVWWWWWWWMSRLASLSVCLLVCLAWWCVWFPDKLIELMDEWMSEWVMEGWMHGLTDGWYMDEWVSDGRFNGWIDWWMIYGGVDELLVEILNRWMNTYE